MAIHRGPGMRTSRTQAIDMGTNPKGFEGGIEYCAQCGHPVGGALPHTHYDQPKPSVGGGSALPIQFNPIKIGKP